MSIWPWSKQKPEVDLDSSDDLAAQLEASRRSMNAAKTKSKRVREQKERQIDTLNEATVAAHMKTIGALTQEQLEQLRDRLRSKLADA